MEELNLESKVKLNNGVEIPILGLGTYLSTGQLGYEAVRIALKVGYRHIDTAAMYGNEKEIGRAIIDDDIPREEIFVTTKLWNSDHGYEKALKAFDISLEKLEMDYVDLYLIHWPVTGLRMDSWRALEQLYFEGKCKAIGVSNFLSHHLEDLLENAEIVPTVDQVEFHPRLQLPDLQDTCCKHGILLEAWSPIMKGRVLNIPELVDIGDKYGKNAVHVTLRWMIQKQIITIPKTVRKERIISNADIYNFELSEDEMRLIDGLDQNIHIGEDPDNVSF